MDYLDANVLFYALTDNGAKGAACKRLLLELPLLTNSLTLDEVAFPLLKKSRPDAVRILRELVACPTLSFAPFAEDCFDSFINLVEAGLDPRDAIHAATALKNGCKVIWSEDKDFDKVKGLTRKVPWK